MHAAPGPERSSVHTTARRGRLGPATFQGSNLPVGADAIKLTIDQASDGINQIHIVYGSTPAPAPATRARLTYHQPDNPWTSSRNYLDGCRFPAHEVQWFGRIIKFLISGADVGQLVSLQQSFKFTQDNGFVSYLVRPGAQGGRQPSNT